MRSEMPTAFVALRSSGPMHAEPAIVSGMADVQAHIAGTVFEVTCAVGDRVREGDTVVVLESMKMEMPVEAEEDGTVRAVHCAPGQAVDEGQVLVELES